MIVPSNSGSWQRSFEMTDKITHHGMVSERKKVKNLHLAADAFILPTYYPTEAQPSAIIEAMSAATPIITCDQGGISQMVRNTLDGIFVAPRSPQLIADAVISLQDHKTWLEISSNARNRFLEVFSAKVIARKWCSLMSNATRQSQI